VNRSATERGGWLPLVSHCRRPFVDVKHVQNLEPGEGRSACPCCFFLSPFSRQSLCPSRSLMGNGRSPFYFKKYEERYYWIDDYRQIWSRVRRRND
jgi:hypothetical protein